MLDKKLKLGGLQVGVPKAQQNNYRFRVANNVFQTLEDVLLPRFHNTAQGNDYGVDNVKVGYISQRNLAPLVACVEDEEDLKIFNELGNPVPSSPIPSKCGAGYELPANGVQFLEKLGNQYFNIPTSGLFKYDGVQAYRAGSPLPYVEVSPADFNTPTMWIRFIQHHVDFQGNVCHSGYTAFNVKTTSNQITFGTGGPIDDTYVLRGKTRSPVDKAVLSNGFFGYFAYVNTQTVDSVNRELNFTTYEHNSPPVGAYLIVRMKDAGTITGVPAHVGIALKVKATGVGTIQFDLNQAKYMDKNHEWVDFDLPSTFTLPMSGDKEKWFTNNWVSVWSSTTETGAFVLQDFLPVGLDSLTKRYFVTTITSATSPAAAWNYVETVFNTVTNMSDFYDVTSVKRLFDTNTRSFTTYKDNGLLSYENEIFINDTTLGGSFEMTNGLSFVVVGESKDGGVQTICGNTQFLLVSRQFKNYYVAGNLLTANYNVQELEETSLGAYSNESSFAVGNKIFFINKQGVWALYPGARCDEVSANIKGFFETFANTHEFEEETFFSLEDFDTFAPIAEIAPADKWLRIRHDVNRKLLFFVTKGDGQGRVLVLNLNNGEFYTWSGLLDGVAGTPDLKDFAVIDGSYYVTRNGTGIDLGKENRTTPPLYPYLLNSPPQLEIAWFTAGEPSLEKKLNQLKLFGIIKGSATVYHKLDWKTDIIEDGPYTHSDSSKYSHKKNLKPANFLSVSVGIKLDVDGLEKFEIEGIECEWSPLQTGMKK